MLAKVLTLSAVVPDETTLPPCVCARATILSAAAELSIRRFVNSTVESSQSVA